MGVEQSRRSFLTTASLAGAASILPGSILTAAAARAAESPPETPTVRFDLFPGVCISPQYVARDLLKAEGFTDVRYVEVPHDEPLADQLVNGRLDFTMLYMPEILLAVDAGQDMTAVGGIHVGCFDLFARNDIRSIADLKGRTVGLPAVNSAEHIFISIMAAYIGLNPADDINWLSDPATKDLFIAGGIDAFLSFPPVTQELRATGIGHVIASSARDRPWSQYYCCILTGRSAYVRDNPNATERVLRAVLKATDICFRQPQLAARSLVDGGFIEGYDFALEALRELGYGVWRDYDPRDTARFYALRMHELGMIGSTPNEIIPRIGDWRFFEDVRKELKA
jgi:NitT/TauT family transport system substrate-binding protein